MNLRALLFATLFIGCIEPASFALSLDDKAVKEQINLAWAITPIKFKKPDGTIIKIRKSQKHKIVLPIDEAREVIMVGMLSAQAAVCGLKDEQISNYRALMRREGQKKRTPQQMIFISQLHLATVMRQTGLIVGNNGRFRVIKNLIKHPNHADCSTEQKDRIREQVKAMVSH